MKSPSKRRRRKNPPLISSICTVVPCTCPNHAHLQCSQDNNRYQILNSQYNKQRTNNHKHHKKHHFDFHYPSHRRFSNPTHVQSKFHDPTDGFTLVTYNKKVRTHRYYPKIDTFTPYHLYDPNTRSTSNAYNQYEKYPPRVENSSLYTSTP